MKQQVETDSPLMRKLIREYIPQANEHCQNQFVRLSLIHISEPTRRS